MNKPTQEFEASSSKIRDLLLGIWKHLSLRRRLQLQALLLLMLASGVAEAGSLAAAVPFLAVLSNPQSLWEVPMVQSIAVGLGFTKPEALLLPVTLVFGFAAVLAAAVRLMNLWANGRLAAAIGSDLSCEAYERTLYQPYAVHLQRNSSAVITAITTQIAQTVQAIESTLQLATSSVVALGLMGVLLVIDWTVACTAIVVFGTAYGLLSVTIRRTLAANSLAIAVASKDQLKSLQEGLGAIRDVLLNGNQNTFLGIYQGIDRPMRRRMARIGFLGSFPRYGLEALGLLLIALLALLLSWQRGSSQSVILTLGSLALGSQRLLPALQQVYACWAAIRAYGAGLEQVLTMLNQSLPNQSFVNSRSPFLLAHSIQFDELSFCYSEESPWVINGIHFEIRRGERIGLIGSTGSGKTTIVDLLMGLLEPNQGRILIDGLDLHDPNYPHRLSEWRAAISHVPQNIFLTDSSIAENIAFGVPRQQIDQKRVRQAAEQAQIAGFVEDSPQGYETFVGERGVRLSGGQRQRIGIARALYRQASVIVLDEATSALDTATEEEVMRALESLSRNLTIVMIAHRLSTLSRCDRIFELASGSPIRVRTPSEMFSDSSVNYPNTFQ